MKDRLITPSYCLVIGASFLLTFSFWQLMPVLPYYLIDEFHANDTMVGFILSCYTIASLCARPFGGYVLDNLSRKPFYLIAYFIFMSMFTGYIIAGTLTMFIVLRIVQGMSFGIVTVGNNTLIIDVMPFSRRGEGLGYFGLSKNVGMSLGPMTGLFLHHHLPYSYIFITSFVACLLGFICACAVRTPYKPPQEKAKLNFNQFVLLKGIPAGISLLLLSIPYGMITNYLAMYCTQIKLQASPGFFFTLMAIGMAISRIFSGKVVDKGKVTQVISIALYLIIGCFFLMTLCPHYSTTQPRIAIAIFYSVSLLMGVGFGILFPAYNTLFVNLAPTERRGSATSTYLTSWDIGLGIGMMGGGYIADISDFNIAFLWGACMTILSTIFFHIRVSPHYHRNKLR